MYLGTFKNQYHHFIPLERPMSIKTLIEYKIQSHIFRYTLGPDWYGIFGADDETDIREQENSDIFYIDWYCRYVILGICGCQILVTTICKGGRMSYI